MTDFSNQKASHYIFGSQWWLMIEWWTSNAYNSTAALRVLDIMSTVMRHGSRGVKGELKVLQIVSKVGSQGKYIHRRGKYFSSGDIILAAIQLGANFVTIV